MISGLILGVGLVFPLMEVLNSWASNSFDLELELSFSTKAWMVSLFIAIVLPLISLIKPIYHQSKISLAEGLSIFRVKTSSITVSMQKLES